MHNTNYISCFPVEDVILYQQILHLTASLVELERRHCLGMSPVEEGKRMGPWYCHLITRAIAHFFPVRVADGYSFATEHSWLVTGNGHIIDLSPVGRLAGPQLIAKGDEWIHLENSFVECPIPTEWVYQHESFKSSLAIMIEHFEGHLKKSKEAIEKAYR